MQQNKLHTSRKMMSDPLLLFFSIQSVVLPDWELSFDLAETPTDGMLDELARATNQHVKWFLRFVLQPTGVNLLRARNKVTVKTYSSGHQDGSIYVIFATRLFFQEDKGLPPQSPQEIVGGLFAAFEGLLIDHYKSRFATFFSEDNVFHGTTRIKAIRPVKGSAQLEFLGRDWLCNVIS